MTLGKPLSLFVASLVVITVTKAQEPAQPKLAGWIGVFLLVGNYDRKFETPKVDKQTYQQTVSYTWLGGRAETVKITLIRDAELAKRYTKDGVKTLPAIPKEVKVGDHVAWDTGAGLLMIDLGDERLLKLEAPTWKFHQSNLAGFAKHFDLKTCAKALDGPPYTDSRRKVEAFRELKKGMSLGDVQAWVGNADKDIGSGIHILAYKLDDGSRVLIGFPDFKKLIYVKHEDKAGKSVELAK
jgi:hypothetical protein